MHHKFGALPRPAVGEGGGGGGSAINDGPRGAAERAAAAAAAAERRFGAHWPACRPGTCGARPGQSSAPLPPQLQGRGSGIARTGQMDRLGRAVCRRDRAMNLCGSVGRQNRCGRH